MKIKIVNESCHLFKTTNKQQIFVNIKLYDLLFWANFHILKFCRQIPNVDKLECCQLTYQNCIFSHSFVKKTPISEILLLCSYKSFYHIGTDGY